MINSFYRGLKSPAIVLKPFGLGGGGRIYFHGLGGARLQHVARCAGFYRAAGVSGCWWGLLKEGLTYHNAALRLWSGSNVDRFADQPAAFR